MTKGEFLTSFDVLYNNIRSNSAPGLEASEIEDIANKALRSLIIEIYNSAFENNEEFRREIANLIKSKKTQIFRGYYDSTAGKFYDKPSTESTRAELTASDKDCYIDLPTSNIYKCTITTVEEVTTVTYNEVTPSSILENAIVLPLEDDLMYITYETASIVDTYTTEALQGRELLVVPTKQDDLFKTRENPFKGPGKNRVLRLDIDTTKVELISDYPLGSYTVKYLAAPSKIEFTPSYVSTDPLCSLSVPFQEKLLNATVQLAKELWK